MFADLLKAAFPIDLQEISKNDGKSLHFQRISRIKIGQKSEKHSLITGSKHRAHAALHEASNGPYFLLCSGYCLYPLSIYSE